MTAQELFRELVAEHAAPVLKAHGFKRRGQYFGLRGTGVWGVLAFWRYPWNTRQSVTFTITLNVACDAFREFDERPYRRERGFKPADLSVVPGSDNLACQWHRNICEVMGPSAAGYGMRKDELAGNAWRIRSPKDFKAMCGHVPRAIEQIAVPELRRRDSMGALVDLYLEDAELHHFESDTALLFALLAAGRAGRARREARRMLRETPGHPGLPGFRRELRRLGLGTIVE